MIQIASGSGEVTFEEFSGKLKAMCRQFLEFFANSFKRRLHGRLDDEKRWGKLKLRLPATLERRLGEDLAR
jgi:hypothetical protein